jgi:hypothetical protein
MTPHIARFQVKVRLDRQHATQHVRNLLLDTHPRILITALLRGTPYGWAVTDLSADAGILQGTSTVCGLPTNSALKQTPIETPTDRMRLIRIS